MDINKEFELKQRELFERFRFGDQYDELKAYYDEYESENHDRYPPYTYENEWVAWLTAKAQAVPEGFVLVPEECSDDMACKIAAIARVCGGIAGDIYEAVVNQAMIEAQEQSHD